MKLRDVGQYLKANSSSQPPLLLSPHTSQASLCCGHWAEMGKRNCCCSLWTHFQAESFNVQVDFCQWGNLEVPQPIRNVKFMLPSKPRSYLIRLRSSYTRTNYYNYSLGKFKSVQTPCLPLPCSTPGSEWRKVMGDKSPELVLHLTYELSRNISLMTRGSLAQREECPGLCSRVRRKYKYTHKK